MKKITTKLFFAAVVLALAALSGCSSSLLERPREAPALDIPRGFGALRVSLTRGAARTVMPEADMENLYLEYSFARDGAATEEKTPVDGVFILKPGNYTLTVRAFTGSGGLVRTLADSGSDGLVAEGSTERDFTIAAGTDAGTVSVTLRPVTDQGTGSLEFGLQYPVGVTVESFTLTRIAGEESFDLLDPSPALVGAGPFVLSGSRANIPAGYYLLQVLLKNRAGLSTGKSEVVHIYQNLTARTRLADYTFTGSNFGTSIDYAAYVGDQDFIAAVSILLSEASPEPNTPDTPVSLKVYGLDVSTKLSVLTGALNRYASLDLSDCTASLATTEILQSTAGGPWGHLDIKASPWVIGMVLPVEVISLNLQADRGPDGLGLPQGTITLKEYNNLRTFAAPGVVRINDSVFRHLAYLERVELPALKVMRNTSHFADCTSLKTVIIPSAEIIGKWAFSNCSALETVEVGQVKSVGPLAFEGANPALTLVTSGPLTWDAGKKQLTRVDGSDVTLLAWLDENRSPAAMPANITKIGDSLFYQMENITSIRLPGITAIGVNAFWGCTNLEEAVLPNVKELGEYALGNTGLIEADFPEVTHVGPRAFLDCIELEVVNLPKIIEIGESALSTGYWNRDKTEVLGKLYDVNLGSSLTTIGKQAFIYCAQLESLRLPETVEYIGHNAFGSQNAIKTLTIEAVTPPFVQTHWTSGEHVYSYHDLFETYSDITVIETIYVPAESVDAYKAAPGWSVYADLIQPE
jgi:hypothetical protein